MGKKIVSSLWVVFLLVSGIGVGMLVQAKVQSLATIQAAAGEASLVSKLVLASQECATALNRTTAERNRLLEHLADVESGARGECTPVMVWSCTVRGEGQ